MRERFLRLLQVDYKLVGVSWARHADLYAPYWRLYWNEGIGLSVIFKERELQFRPDRLYLIPPETHYRPRPLGEVGQLFIHFLASPPYQKLSEPEILAFEVTSHDAELAMECVEALERGQAEHPKVMAVALALVAEALRRVPCEKLWTNAHLDERVIRIMSVLDESERSISNKELADIACMGPNTFLRLFKEATGDSPQLYARRQRIAKACLLLGFSDLSIKEIAEKLGFCDRHHFTNCFTEHVGQTPHAYRRTRLQQG